MENLISVIIVNWNGKKWLKKCLDSLASQSYKNFEVIFVDNASSDDSVEFIKTNYPWVKIAQNDKNDGFAKGNNIGFKNAKGDYVVLLNNDTWVENNFLEEFIKAFREIKSLGCAQSKIVSMNEPGKLDSCGSFWTSSSFLYHYGYGKDSSLDIYNQSMPIFSAKGASMMIDRRVIEKIGLFDDDFWSYYEETDFCHRVWLAGYECWYYPKAICYHAQGGTSAIFDNSYIQFHNFKNKLLSFLKNFEAKSLVKLIPFFIFFNFALSVFWLLQGKFSHFLSIYKSIWWNLVHVKKTLEKRKAIQLMRVRRDKDIAKKVTKNPNAKYYYYLFFGLEKYQDREII